MMSCLTVEVFGVVVVGVCVAAEDKVRVFKTKRTRMMRNRTKTRLSTNSTVCSVRVSNYDSRSKMLLYRRLTFELQ